MNVLLVEDEKITRISLTNTLKDEGFNVEACETGNEAIQKLATKNYDIIITDLRLPGKTGLEILETAKKNNPNTKVILMTAYATLETAVKAIKLGAYDYLIKPFSPDKLIVTLNHIQTFQNVVSENINLKKRLNLFENRQIITANPQMLKLVETIKIVAQNDFTVLIEGESGSGKELVARNLHFYSPRVKHNFIAVNCSSIPESLLESELFGFEKGSFTGANKTHQGYFERANGGSIFLDDIDDLPLALQAKLLRVLQEKEIVRIGGSKPIKIDVRVIVATKTDLMKLVEEEKFRKDLYYRLNIIPIKIPPLRERKDDIPLLIEHFFEKYGVKEKLSLLTPQILQKLKDYNWPGNVRELENFIERLIAISDIPGWEEEILSGLKSQDAIKESVNEETTIKDSEEEVPNYPKYQEFIREKELEIFSWALNKTKGNISKAAELLGLPRTTLRSKLGNYKDELNF